jgi:hypothetical protein
MTENESFTLMGFLRQLIQTRINYKDALAEKKINEAFSTQPNASYLLVQRAIFLEMELEKTKKSLTELQSQYQVTPTTTNSEHFLNESINNWGKNLENRESTINVNTIVRKKKYLSIEDKGLKFLIKNSKIIWALVLALWVIVYFNKQQ